MLEELLDISNLQALSDAKPKHRDSQPEHRDSQHDAAASDTSEAPSTDPITGKDEREPLDGAGAGDETDDSEAIAALMEAAATITAQQKYFFISMFWMTFVAEGIKQGGA
ncbi:hypothetical protein Dimus_001961 [Dionaea muscipula]